MAHYAIGDVQGCLGALEVLLARIQFNAATDTVWFAGDLVARGPDSLGTLRLIKRLGTAANTVLGNHDLHLLAAHYGLARVKPRDLTEAIFTAPDRDELMHWLQHRPLLLHDKTSDCVLTHAGIHPNWSLAQAQSYAQEIEHALQSGQIKNFLSDMYGNEPAAWSNTLTGTTRLRVLTNFFTRMRLMSDDGHMDFLHKEDLSQAPAGLHPWFNFPNPALTTHRVLFGHWAALEGHTGHPKFIALDTGCVWGRHLTAYRLDDGEFFTSAA